MLESIKHSIVLLQIAKNTAHPVNGVYNHRTSHRIAERRKHKCKDSQHCCSKTPDLATERYKGLSPIPSLSEGSLVTNVEHGIEPAVECVEEAANQTSQDNRLLPRLSAVSNSVMDNNGTNFAGASKPSGPFGDSVTAFQLCSKAANSPIILPPSVVLPIPDTSYSSSEDEDYFDAKDDGDVDLPSGPIKYERDISKYESDMKNASHANTKTSIIKDGIIDYDAIYEDEDEEELGSVVNQGSVISHLLSQVKLGMDLTKVVLPTFILERRSLLEMYADFFAHPDLFVNIADGTDSCDRMIRVLKWYLSAFHAGRKSSVAKKPYNPILGEIFRCTWDLPELSRMSESDESLVTDGPVPWCSRSQLAFIAEQVSHHPPISAFYAEHYDKRISFCAHIWTKSKFLGLSIGVHMIGQGCISVLDSEEEYIVTFPNGYGRSILTVPWVELGGTTTISCAKTGYSANIEFLTKPFYGGKKHRIIADVYQPNEKKSFLTVTGEWNGCMCAKWTNGKTEVFVDTTTIPINKKIVPSISTQDEMESRRLWKNVTAGLRLKDIEKATAAKYELEQKQRLEAKERKDSGNKWETKNFHENGENWIYDQPLVKRLIHSSTSNVVASAGAEL